MNFTPEMGGLFNIAIITVLFSITFAYSFACSKLQHTVILNKAITVKVASLN